MRRLFRYGESAALWNVSLARLVLCGIRIDSFRLQERVAEECLRSLWCMNTIHIVVQISIKVLGNSAKRHLGGHTAVLRFSVSAAALVGQGCSCRSQGMAFWYEKKSVQVSNHSEQ
jgi:hypothetical protein